MIYCYFYLKASLVVVCSRSVCIVSFHMFTDSFFMFVFVKFFFFGSFKNAFK